MKHSLLLSTAFVLMVFWAKAQTDYQLSSFDAPFEELVESTEYEVEQWVIPQISISLDFPFMLGNETLTSLAQLGLGFEWGMPGEGPISESISLVGGFLRFGPSAVLEDQVAPSKISWLTEGEAGSRILKIEYLDMAFMTEIEMFGTATNRMNVQLWLHEDGNVIEYRFGPSNIENPEIAFEAYGGPDPGPILFMLSNYNFASAEVEAGFYLSGDPADPELVPVTNYNEFQAELFDPTGGGTPLTGVPADGQVYRLEPMTLSAGDRVKTGFKLYPTIAERELVLSGLSNRGDNYRIVNVNGSTVQSGVLNNDRVNVAALAPGMYLMQVDGQLKAEKFFKR